MATTVFKKKVYTDPSLGPWEGFVWEVDEGPKGWRPALQARVIAAETGIARKRDNA